MMPTYDSPVVRGAIAVARSLASTSAATAAKITIFAICFVVASVLFWRLMWDDGPDQDYYVSARIGTVFLFVVSASGAMWTAMLLLVGWP
jgi:hypothetical protein